MKRRVGPASRLRLPARGGWAQCLLLTAVLFGPGCAYFNTYYNARKAFDQAERAREQQSSAEAPGPAGTAALARTSYNDLYEKTIRKASAVLEFHPRSRWVDDSLMLLGKAFYWQAAYQKGVLKFDELEANFPRSDLLPEARYWKALCLWRLSNHDAARSLLGYLADHGSHDLSLKALLSLGEIAFEEEDFLQAADIYSRVASKRGVSRRLRVKALNGAGECSAAHGDYESAIASFRRVLALSPSPASAYGARMRIGECLQAQGGHGQALAIYQDLLKEAAFRPFSQRALLNIGDCYEKLGKPKQALDTYESIARDAPSTEEAALALYAAGELYLRSYNDLGKAKDAFERAQKPGGRYEAVGRAQKRTNDIAELDRYRSALKDSGAGPAAAAIQFRLAELYRLTFDQRDSAAVAYEAVALRFPDSDWAPKALYAAYWLRESMGDSVASLASLRSLAASYRETDYADTARAKLGLVPYSGYARGLFLAAESLRLSDGRPESYLPIYEMVASVEPRSPYAAKAVYVVAWTNECVLGDSTAAGVRYRQVIELFPASDLRPAAETRLRRLGGGPAQAPATRDIEPSGRDASSVALRGKAPVPVDGTPEAGPGQTGQEEDEPRGRVGVGGVGGVGGGRRPVLEDELERTAPADTIVTN